MSAVYVEILNVRGSAPRDAGTVMKVTAKRLYGTIGGGALEHKATQIARDMLGGDTAEDATRTIPLGPGLGQCCGGAVTLLFTCQPRSIAAPPDLPTPQPAPEGVMGPLWIWGAGHVGQALESGARALGAFDITWVDDAAERFPPDAHNQVIAADMPLLVQHAPRDAAHLIVTYSHDIDLALCAALLRHGFGFCGLIGSETKRAKFESRLRAMGLDPAPITCPIGDKRLGKHPDAIAHGALAALLGAGSMKENA